MPCPSLEALERQITSLAARIHAANYRLLCLIAEFDRRRGWSHWGIRSCAHWLNWHCLIRMGGIGPVAARDKVLADPQAAGRSELEDGTALAGESARRLACDASVVRLVENADGMPLNVGRKTRSIPPAIHRALRARDLRLPPEGGCRFPGCTARHFVEGHHMQHWAHSGKTSLENLVQLCHFHHRLVHEGEYGVRVCGRQRFEFT